MDDASRRRFWSRTRRLTAGLLLLWLAVNLGVPWFARDFHGRRVLGFPLAYGLAAVGLLMLYLVIIVTYVVAMDRIEADYLDDLAARGQDPGGASQ